MAVTFAPAVADLSTWHENTAVSPPIGNIGAIKSILAAKRERMAKAFVTPCLREAGDAWGLPLFPRRLALRAKERSAKREAERGRCLWFLPSAWDSRLPPSLRQEGGGTATATEETGEAETAVTATATAPAAAVEEGEGADRLPWLCQCLGWEWRRLR